MNIIIPIGITAAMIGSGSPGEPSMPSGTMWAEGTYPSTGTVRLRPNSRSYEVILAHDSTGGAFPPPERDPAHWADLGPTSVPVEIAWAPYTATKKGDEVIRTQTHRRYRAAKDMTTAENVVAPELDDATWLDIGPTNRWAPFDQYTNTKAVGTSSITYVLSPGYFNALALYGLVGTGYTVTVKSTPGGAVIYSRTGLLTDDPAGWYEYLFVTPSTRSKLVFTDIPLSPAAELTITITAGSDAVGIGMIVVGDLVPMFGEGEWGGAEYGATAEPITYSYINTDEYGSTRIVRRHSSTNLRCSVRLPRKYADDAVRRLQSVLDQPVACIATTKAAGYDGLNVFGLIASAPVSYDSFNIASIDFNVKGLI